MNFLVDAQLPRRLVRRFQEAGHDAVHTLDLPRSNRTPDQEVNAIALREGRVVVTKDVDFVNSHLLRGQPRKLLVISTGNITNAELEALLVPTLPAIIDSLLSNSYVELTRKTLIIHG